MIFATRLEKVKFMYRVAVATYGTLYGRTPSFATFEWSHNVQQNGPSQNGNALLLATAIKELGTASENFCKHCVLGLLSTFFEKFANPEQANKSCH